MILCDRKQLKNPNGLILGTPGSGKSFAAKREMTNAFLITDDDIIICDPEAEYFSLVQRLDGQVIRLSPTGKGIDGKPQYVNPMDINLNYSEDDSPLALKSDFILSLCELVIGGKEGLQPVDKTVIDRAVRNVYRPFLADPDPEKMPILGDLYDELLKQPEPEAARIASALELYVSGSLNVFNHRTNVELSNRLVCFDIKQLGKQLKKLGIEAMARELVQTHAAALDGKKDLFREEKPSIGKCPRCGSPVHEGKKNYYCSNRECAFVMWKNDRFFEERKTAFSAKIAAALLKSGKANVKKLYSPKTGKTYDGTIVLADTGGKYVNYRIEVQKN